MKKIILLLMILFMSTLGNTQEEDKKKKKSNNLSAYSEITAYDFQQYNYTFDLNYRIMDRVSLSSWNTITSGRTIEQGYNYSVISGLVNFKSKNFKHTLSLGYSRTEQYSFDFRNNQFMVKLRLKLI